MSTHGTLSRRDEWIRYLAVHGWTPEEREAKWRAKYGATPQPVATVWPFAARRAPDEHEMLAAIDKATRGIPEQWRQDVCQELAVAMLTGDVTLDTLNGAVKAYAARVYNQHPLKYGDISLDAPWRGPEGDTHLTRGDLLVAAD